MPESPRTLKKTAKSACARVFLPASTVLHCHKTARRLIAHVTKWSAEMDQRAPQRAWKREAIKKWGHFGSSIYVGRRKNSEQGGRSLGRVHSIVSVGEEPPRLRRLVPNLSDPSCPFAAKARVACAVGKTACGMAGDWNPVSIKTEVLWLISDKCRWRWEEVGEATKRKEVQIERYSWFGLPNALYEFAMRIAR